MSSWGWRAVEKMMKHYTFTKVGSQSNQVVTARSRKNKILWPYFVGGILAIAYALYWLCTENTNFWIVTLLCAGVCMLVYYCYNKVNAYHKQVMLDLLYSVIWLVILFVFAYTIHIDSIFNNQADPMDVYHRTQGSTFTCISNIGFVFLALYDYWLAHKKFPTNIVVMTFVAIVIAVFLCWCSWGSITGKVANYTVLKSIPNLTIILHGIFLMVLLYLKYYTIKQDKQLNLTEFK